MLSWTTVHLEQSQSSKIYNHPTKRPSSSSSTNPFQCCGGSEIIRNRGELILQTSDYKLNNLWCKDDDYWESLKLLVSVIDWSHVGLVYGNDPLYTTPAPPSSTSTSHSLWSWSGEAAVEVVIFLQNDSFSVCFGRTHNLHFSLDALN